MNLKQALQENNSIRLGLTAKDWKEAVKLSVEPLIESGAVKPNIMMLSNPQKDMVLIIF